MHLNISRFDLLSIQLVVLCAEAGSLTAGSKRANCSVSSGSQRIAALERAVGQKLFERDYRGLRLTEFGVLFVRHARDILGQFEQLKSNLALALADRDSLAPQ
jgi:DNA-binding transcriptional LysR family regulator